MPYHCHQPFAARRAYKPVDGLAILGDLVKSLDEDTKHQQQRKRCPALVNPRFDVYETAEEYVLEGELPGVSDKKSISLEFTDSRTLKVEGSIRRPSIESNTEENASSEKQEQNLADRASADSEMSDATLRQEDEKLPSYRATVEETADEDDNMSADFEVVNTPRTSTPAPEEPSLFAEKPQTKSTTTTTATTSTEKAVPTQDTSAPAKQSQSNADDRKYWVKERSYGKFVKSFTFASFVDQDSVRATLENGLLRIHVPKRAAYVRQIAIE